jgi:hypothetical protein
MSFIYSIYAISAVTLVFCVNLFIIAGELINQKTTKMKKLVSFIAAAGLVATLMTTSSCTKTCDAGYEGSDCKTEVRAKYLGTWSESGTFTSGSTQGPVTSLSVLRATSSGAVTDLIATFTFNGTAYSVKSTLGSDGKTFTIPSQTEADGSTATGSGSFPTATTVSETVTLNYPASGSVAAFTVDVVLTGTKQ